MKRSYWVLGIVAALVLHAVAPIAVGAAPAGQEEISYILQLEFDGNDVMEGVSWTKNRGDEVDLSDKISDGTIKFDRWDMGSSQASLSFAEPVDLAGRENIYFETRVKYTMVAKREDNRVASGNPLINLFGVTTNYQETVFAKNGYLAYGGTNTNNTQQNTEFAINDQTWYTIRIHLNNVTKKYGVYMADDEGNEFDAIGDTALETENSYGLAIDALYHIVVGYTAEVAMEFDYIRLWDSDVRISSTNIKSGAVDISNDTDFVIDFSKRIDKNTLSGITVSDEDGNVVPTEITLEDDSRRAVLYFTAGLKYAEQYTVFIPNTVRDTDGKTMNETNITFSTQEKPLLVERQEAAINGGKAKASARVCNTGAQDKPICILLLIYDENGMVVKITNSSYTVSAGQTAEITAECDAGAGTSAKTYVWNGVTDV